MNYLAVISSLFLLSSCSFTCVTQEAGTLKLIPVNIETMENIKGAFHGQGNKEDREERQEYGEEA